jgi:nucleotide-binding universal stress UspA family protein
LSARGSGVDGDSGEMPGRHALGVAIFDRVLCGVDGTPAGDAAAAIAARVVSPTGTLELVAVAETHFAVQAGWGTPAVLEAIEHEAEDALKHSRAAVEPTHQPETALLEGAPADALLHEIERRAASLAVVGTKGHSRAVGIALGSVATFLLHEAPCSVLVVREGVNASTWPRSIAVGVDGSPESARALDVAREMAARFKAPLRTILATREAQTELEGARRLASDLVELPGGAVDELAHAGEQADLVVVGSRGLTGIQALGSVSERVAHEARCPVLVVRALP